ncbi:MAG TPA: hypothetical protein VHV55_04740 [Pirellulales bacterium]|nr:hypothetical protein [Pirellulales bacterium]
MLVKIEPALADVGNRDRLKAQRAGRADLELSVDLGGHLAGGVAVGTDPRLPPLTVLRIGQVPDSAPEVGAHAPDTKRSRF